MFLGCEAITAGAGSLACTTAGAAAGGGVYNAMMCPPGVAIARCAATGAITGAAIGLTAGITAELGASALTTGALSSGAGNATSQLLTTGHINPAELATAMLTGAALTYAGSKLTSPGHHRHRPHHRQRRSGNRQRHSSNRHRQPERARLTNRYALANRPGPRSSRRR